MINLNEYLKESLLDDEEDLVTDDTAIIDKSLKEVWDFLNDRKKNGGIEISKKFVIDNQIKKGGFCTLIPVDGYPEKIDMINALTDKRKIKYFNKAKGIYNGNYEIYKPIPEWPVLLKIGNPRNFTIYSKEPITQNMIPNICLSLDIVYMSGAEGLEFTCRYANIMGLNKINKPITINTFSDPKYRSEIIDISNTDNFIKKWSDLNGVISNCKYISIMKGDFVDDIINRYDDKNIDTHFEVEMDEPELIKLQQKNFKNLETVYLYKEDSDDFYYLTFYRGKWEFHSNKHK